MRIKICIDGQALRRWHVFLIERLSSRKGIEVCVDGVGGAQVVAAKAQVFHFGAMNAAPSSGLLSDPAPAAALALFSTDAREAFDFTLDLREGERAAVDGVLRITFDGLPGERGLRAAINAERTPTMQVVGGGRVLASGRLGTEFIGDFTATLEDMLARACTLILAAFDGAASPRLPQLPREPRAAAQSAKTPNAHVLKAAVARALKGTARQVYRSWFHTPHWRIGWRKTSGGDLFDLRRLSGGAWARLADDGRRFYADPFPIVHRGRLTLFVEEFEHRIGKGVISAVEFGADGPIGTPEIVLEQPGHLSYPFVFENRGSLWMIPESSSASAVDLFRCANFPSRWVHEATLVSGVAASDATLLERDGVWWMFATVRDGGGSFSDALHLWSAPDFRGPWTPHPRNPVLIDIASARPAGQFVARDGMLFRPVQDCRKGYGAALGIARVDRLDFEAYSQTVETLLTPGPNWRGRRLHTVNAAGGFEFIDGSAVAPRWPGLDAFRRSKTPAFPWTGQARGIPDLHPL